ncbi:hypothetical protein [Kribbella sp. NPDC048928]|uniref:hypothetical protein n=1 Tax=Kribbella sp. NPDC048928 TaxID=3364111 RepID=UPI00371D228D
MLSTTRVDLEPFELERDLAALHAMFSDPDWARGGNMSPTVSEAATRERLGQEFGDNGGWTWHRLVPAPYVVGQRADERGRAGG